MFVLFVLVGVSMAPQLFAQQDESSQDKSPQGTENQQPAADVPRGGGFRGRGRFGEQVMGYLPLLQIDSVKKGTQARR